uniref:SANT domain-containing protein n=1 Tax=Rhabditophanes sp. KR3021 TaxID=114890 RepID=A0AC35U7E3_9BILA
MNPTASFSSGTSSASSTNAKRINSNLEATNLDSSTNFNDEYSLFDDESDYIEAEEIAKNSPTREVNSDRPGRRKQIFDFGSNKERYLSRPSENVSMEEDEDHISILDPKSYLREGQAVQPAPQRNEVFGNLTKLFPKQMTLNPLGRISTGGATTSSPVQQTLIKTNRYSKPSSTVNYLREQALASIASNEAAVAAKSKTKHPRPITKTNIIQTYVTTSSYKPIQHSTNESYMGKSKSSMDHPPTLIDQSNVHDNSAANETLKLVDETVTKTAHTSSSYETYPSTSSRIPSKSEDFKIQVIKPRPSEGVQGEGDNLALWRKINVIPTINEAPLVPKEVSRSHYELVDSLKFNAVGPNSRNPLPKQDSSWQKKVVYIKPNEKVQNPTKVGAPSQGTRPQLMSNGQNMLARKVFNVQGRPVRQIHNQGRSYNLARDANGIPRQNVQFKSAPMLLPVKKVNHDTGTSSRVVYSNLNSKVPIARAMPKWVPVRKKSDANNRNVVDPKRSILTQKDNNDSSAISPFIEEEISILPAVRKPSEISLKARALLDSKIEFDSRYTDVSSKLDNKENKNGIAYDILWRMKDCADLNKFTNGEDCNGKYEISEAFAESIGNHCTFKIIKELKKPIRSISVYNLEGPKLDKKKLNKLRLQRSKSVEIGKKLDKISMIPVSRLERRGITVSKVAFKASNKLKLNKFMMTMPSLSPKKPQPTMLEAAEAVTRKSSTGSKSSMSDFGDGITVTEIDNPPPVIQRQKPTNPAFFQSPYKQFPRPNVRMVEHMQRKMFPNANIARFKSHQQEKKHNNWIVDEKIDKVGTRTVRTIYTRHNQSAVQKTTQGRDLSIDEIPKDVLEIAKFYKFDISKMNWNQGEVERMREYGRKMTSCYKYLVVNKEDQEMHLEEEIRYENEGKNLNFSKLEFLESPPRYDTSAPVIQTIRGQILKRGRGRPRKAECEKTVLEEEIILRSEEMYKDLSEMDESTFLSTEEIMYERKSGLFSHNADLFEDDKLNETSIVSISNEVEGMNKRPFSPEPEYFRRSVSNEYGPSGSQQHHRNDAYNTSAYGEFPGIKEENTPYSRSNQQYAIHDNNTVSMRDNYIKSDNNGFHKNRGDSFINHGQCHPHGVKYLTLKDMEVNEYDKITKTEQSIYGPRPNTYTRFIEANRDMFLSDYSLRHVFDEFGSVRETPYTGDLNLPLQNQLINFPNYGMDSPLDDYDDRYYDPEFDASGNPCFNREDSFDEKSFSGESDDLDDSGESSTGMASPFPRLISSAYKESSSQPQKQRKPRVGKPRGPYMTKKRRLEALRAAQGMGNSGDDSSKNKRPVGRPKGSTKRKFDDKGGSMEPLDPATISINDPISPEPKGRSAKRKRSNGLEKSREYSYY